jgi:hypothetical protein
MAPHRQADGGTDPATGERREADVSYKRLTRTIDLTGATSDELSFWSSYATETDWDVLFVEAHPVGSDDWTTLPDANGHTQTGTGESCAGALGRAAPRSSLTTRGRPASRRARQATGMRPPARRRTGRSGRSTCLPMLASRSRYPSPRERLGYLAWLAEPLCVARRAAATPSGIGRFVERSSAPNQTRTVGRLRR